MSEPSNGAWLGRDGDAPEGSHPSAATRDLLAQVITESPALVTIVDEKLRMVFCNDAFRQYGWDPLEMVGQSPLIWMHPDDLERAAVGLRALGQRADLRSAPYRLRRADGEYESFDVLPATIEGPDGQAYFAFMLMTNPFLRAQTMALTEIASGAPIQDALTVLAQEFSRNRPGAVISFDGTPSDPALHERTPRPAPRASVGSVPGVLAGVVGGVQDLTPGAPWTRALESLELTTVTGLDGLPAFARDEAEARGLRAAVFLATPDPGRSQPALIASWTMNPETFEILETNVMGMITVVRLALEQRASQELLEQMAHHDPLTGLANRARFFSRLAAAIQDSGDTESLAVVYLDLDDFKPVNDRHGHEAGDQVLAELGRRFSSVVRANDMVARLGGDEFAVLLSGPSSSSADDAADIVARLLAVAREPFPRGATQAIIGATAGVVFVEHPRAVAPDALVRRADDALYRAKRQRKGSFEITTA